MKYKVVLSWKTEEYIIDAESENDAKNKAIWQNESELYHKVFDVEASPFETTKVQYCGSDSFCRPIFKAVDAEKYYGITEILLSNHDFHKHGKERISEKDLTYFGNHFDCVPVGDPVKPGTIEIVWRSLDE